MRASGDSSGGGGGGARGGVVVFTVVATIHLVRLSNYQLCEFKNNMWFNVV